jgi:hypothetical protein
LPTSASRPNRIASWICSSGSALVEMVDDDGGPVRGFGLRPRSKSMEEKGRLGRWREATLRFVPERGVGLRFVFPIG